MIEKRIKEIKATSQVQTGLTKPQSKESVSVQTTQIQPTAISRTTLQSEIFEVPMRLEASQRKPDQEPSQEPSKKQEEPKLNVSAPNRQ